MTIFEDSKAVVLSPFMKINIKPELIDPIVLQEIKTYNKNTSTIDNICILKRLKLYIDSILYDFIMSNTKIILYSFILLLLLLIRFFQYRQIKKKILKYSS